MLVTSVWIHYWMANSWFFKSIEDHHINYEVTVVTETNDEESYCLHIMAIKHQWNISHKLWRPVLRFTVEIRYSGSCGWYWRILSGAASMDMACQEDVYKKSCYCALLNISRLVIWTYYRKYSYCLWSLHYLVVYFTALI